jgi:uncharacterized protein (UPF0216 family)
MTKNDILRMAREAGLYEDGKFFVLEHSELERFAALVAAQERESYEHTLALQQRSYQREIEIEVEAEREACAKVCDQVGDRDRDSHAYDAAAAIRARGQA